MKVLQISPDPPSSLSPQMDVEGYEPLVVMGAQKLLETRNVWFIV